MAITKTLTFSGISVERGGGSIEYNEHLMENAEITIEQVSDMIDDGQTLVAAYDVSFSVDLYDDTVLSDSNIYFDASQDPVKSNITFNGVSGGSNVAITDVIINGSKKFDQNRVAVTLTGTKRAVSLSNVTTES
mgnify:FL=1|jgi:hypothetical protein